MTEIPELPYTAIIRALQRDGWVVVRQKGSHIRIQKHNDKRILKITVPAHKPVKRSTLSHILNQAAKKLPHFQKLLGPSVLAGKLR